VKSISVWIERLNCPASWGHQERLDLGRDAIIAADEVIRRNQCEMVVPPELLILVLVTITHPALRPTMPKELLQFALANIQAFEDDLDELALARLRTVFGFPARGELAA
jgi:hypothetical protein